MSETEQEKEQDLTRIYEVGYHIVPTVKDEDVEKVVGTIRSSIEKEGGSFIAEGSPSLVKLAYSIELRESEKYTAYDRAHFGWIKFEGTPELAKILADSLEKNVHLMRSVVFKTVREDTRAVMKAPTLREVKRTDTIRSSPRRAVEAEKTPVSEKELDKVLEELTVE
ncbi:MAG: 30S ribosomal protein S6 [Minisyncoccia bacterium]